jgi:hypothetical protein
MSPPDGGGLPFFFFAEAVLVTSVTHKGARSSKARRERSRLIG